MLEICLIAGLAKTEGEVFFILDSEILADGKDLGLEYMIGFSDESREHSRDKMAVEEGAGDPGAFRREGVPVHHSM